MSSSQSVSAHYTLTLATINRIGLIVDGHFAFELHDHQEHSSTKGLGVIPSGRPGTPNSALIGLALALRSARKGSHVAVRATNQVLVEFGTLITECKGVDAMALIGVPSEALPAWQAATRALEPFTVTFEYVAESDSLVSSLLSEAKTQLAIERKSFITETVSLSTAA